jgi:hypothetical protein
MRNLFISVVMVACFILTEGSLFNKNSHANETSIPIIDQNIPTNIETATFAMG